MSDEERFSRQELYDEIQARITSPSRFIPSEGYWNVDMAAAAVTALFESAGPAADSQLRQIDLPAELQAAAQQLRHDAEEALDASFKTHNETGELDVEKQTVADRLGFLANVVNEVEKLITEPARMLMTLVRDRDLWQQAYARQAEMLMLTEAGLAQSQASGLALAEGQSKLIQLLERVARGIEESRWESIYGTEIPYSVTKYSADGMSATHTPLFRCVTKEDMERARELHNGTLSDVLPDIRSTLRQVTALETDASGRLVVAQQPAPETAP